MHDRYQAFLGFLGMVRTKVGFWRTLSAFFLVYLFVLIIVRAGTQSITADEALNYNSFLRDSFGQVFSLAGHSLGSVRDRGSFFPQFFNLLS